MDHEFNAISLGVEYSQLTADETRFLYACLARLLPFGWTESVLHTWYHNRKLSVVREGFKTRYYGLTPTAQWRLLLETSSKDGKVTCDWKVGDFQWLPVEDTKAHQQMLNSMRKA